MKLVSFKGGIHPDDGKRLSKDKPIERLIPADGEYVYPLSQHIGAPAKDIVKRGDRVLRGQMIAEAGGFVSSPIFSSVSGTVKKIEPRYVPTGDKVNSIVIESDGKNEEMTFEKPRSYKDMDKKEILSLIQNAGIVGMGGAGFPTHVKLSPPPDCKIDYIIANCAECEPYITADYRRMLEYPERLIEGLKIAMSLFDGVKGILAIEDNKKDCIEKLDALVKDEPDIEVVALKAKYPQGAERQLIYATTGRAINSTMLPAHAGCIVDNVETLVALQNAVVNGIPLFERVITVSGDAIQQTANFLAPLGMSQNALIEKCDGTKSEPEKIISGGPMMGFAMHTTKVPVTKTSSAMLLFTKDAVKANAPSACINCGRCVDACPSRIVPSRLADFALRGDEETFVAWDGLECIECGSCSAVCPAYRHLKQAIGSMRKQTLANRKKKK